MPQTTKFNIVYQQPETRRKLAETFFTLTQQDLHKKVAIQTSKIEEYTLRYITEIIEIPPTNTVITNQITPELEAACINLQFRTKITAFTTYVRENTGINIHINQFTPLFEKSSIPKTLVNILPTMS